MPAASPSPTTRRRATAVVSSTSIVSRRPTRLRAARLAMGAAQAAIAIRVRTAGPAKAMTRDAAGRRNCFQRGCLGTSIRSGGIRPSAGTRLMTSVKETRGSKCTVSELAAAFQRVLLTSG
jgi:hypothetical protein